MPLRFRSGGRDMSSQVMQVIDMAISLTKDVTGATDAALGDVRPDNTSAIIAVRETAAVPLKLQEHSYHQFIEDYVRICVDIMAGGLRHPYRGRG